MASKQLTKEEIVRETVAFYNSVNRAFDTKLNTCCYTDQVGNHCAVGRCMLAKKRPRINSDDNTKPIDIIISRFNDSNLDHLLKEKYRGHGFQFWSDLQGLHDNARYWTENGISDAGKKYVLDVFGVKL
jgi:hypothetical protein